MRVKIDGLRESCATLRQASAELSQAARQASGQLRQGMESLAASLQQIAQLPDKLDSLLDKQVPRIEQALKNTIEQAQQSMHQVVEHINTTLKENIKLASREAQKNILLAGQEAQNTMRVVAGEMRSLLEQTAKLSRQIEAEIKGLIDHADQKMQQRLQQVNAIVANIHSTIRDTHTRLDALLEKADKKLTRQLQNLDKVVNNWLGKLNQIAGERLTQLAEMVNVFQLQNQQLANLVQQLSTHSLDKLDHVSAKRLRDLNFMIERLRRSMETFKLNPFSAKAKNPLILGISPPPVFLVSDLPEQITIHTLNLAETSSWKLHVLAYPENNVVVPDTPLATPRIMAVDYGIGDIRISGDFLKRLKADRSYVLMLVVKQQDKTPQLAYSVFSLRSESLRLQLQLALHHATTKDKIFPLIDKSYNFQIEECYQDLPIFTVQAPALPERTATLQLQASLRQGQQGSGLVTGVGFVSMKCGKYNVSVRIVKENGYSLFHRVSLINRGQAKFKLAELFQGNSSEKFLSYLSLAANLQQTKQKLVPYWLYYLNPRYVVYLDVIRQGQ